MPPRQTPQAKPEPDVRYPVRYRLIRTRGRSLSWHVWGAVEAQTAAQEAFDEGGIPIAVCSAPEEGIVRHLYTVGAKKRR